MIMNLCLLTVPLGKLLLTSEMYDSLSVTFWAEAIALNTFGVAWIVAGKYIPLTTDEEDRVHLFQKQRK